MWVPLLAFSQNHVGGQILEVCYLLVGPWDLFVILVIRTLHFNANIECSSIPIHSSSVGPHLVYT